MNGVTIFYFVVGFLVVFIFSLNYFNHPGYPFTDDEASSSDDQDEAMLEPALPRYLTERFEYNLYRGFYVLVAEVIYVFLVLFMPDLVGIGEAGTLSAATPDGGEQERVSLVPTQGNILLATLIITGVAPNLPMVRDWLENSKLFLHRKAQIPRKGHSVYRNIKAHTPKYTSSATEEILLDSRYARASQNDHASRADLDLDDFASPKWTLEARWAKLSYLLHYLDGCSRKQPYKSYISNPELRYQSITNSYDRLQQLMAAHKADQITEPERVKLSTRLDAALGRTYRLVSCLLYLAGRTDAAVDCALDELGYAGSEENSFPIPWRTVVMIIAAIVGAIIAGSLLSIGVSHMGLSVRDAKIETGEILKWIGYSVPFLVVPVLLVLVAKRYLSQHSNSWPLVTEFDRYKTLSDRPWEIYFVMALLAYLIGSLTLYSLAIAVTYMKGGSPDYLDKLQAVMFWSSIVFITAGYTAFRLDSAPNPGISRIRCFLVRAAGVLSQGILTAAATYFVFIHTKDIPLDLVRAKKDDLDQLFVFCVISFALGTFINMSTSVGRLRQRRQHGRRLVRRQVEVQFDQQSIQGKTVNVSNEGALIRLNGALNTQASGGEPKDMLVKVTNGAQAAAEAKIVRVRGERLHLCFTNTTGWLKLQDALGVPSPA